MDSLTWANDEHVRPTVEAVILNQGKLTAILVFTWILKFDSLLSVGDHVDNDHISRFSNTTTDVPDE
jgi:hypothetical protein